MILDCLPGPNLITTVLIKWWAERSESERKEMLKREVGGCLLKIEEEAVSQGILAASKSWEKQGNGFSPGTSRRISPLNTFRPSETRFGLVTWRTIR